MRLKVISLAALIALTILWWWFSRKLLGFSLLSVLPFGVTIAGMLFAVILVWSARRTSPILWIFAGLFVLVGLFYYPSYSISMGPMDPALPVWLHDLRNLMTGIWPDIFPFLAIIAAALLLSSGLNSLTKGRLAAREPGDGFQGQARRHTIVAVACLGLSALLIVKMLYNLYWVMVWDTTDDSLGYFWLVLPFLAVLSSGFMLMIVFQGRLRMAGLVFTLLVSGMMIAVSALGQQVDFRQLTKARGERVARAIEAYSTRAGRYPQDLHDLVPSYMLSLPGPVIIYGEDWCYDGGKDFYRLGYVNRDHWSSPILTGQVVAVKGVAPDLAPICDAEITAALRERYPDVFNEEKNP